VGKVEEEEDGDAERAGVDKEVIFRTAGGGGGDGGGTGGAGITPPTTASAVNFLDMGRA